MSKISKKLMKDYKNTKKGVELAKSSHQVNIDKIKDVIKPLIDEKYLKNNCHHYIIGIKFCYDDDMKLKENSPIEYEWREISERSYREIYRENKKKDPNCNSSFFGPIKIKEEYILEPEYIIKKL